MGVIRCPGGHEFRDGEIPSPHEFTLIPDTALESLVQRVLDAAKHEGDAGDAVGFLLSQAGPTAYRCPECGRLLVFWEGIEKQAASYVAESAE